MPQNLRNRSTQDLRSVVLRSARRSRRPWFSWARQAAILLVMLCLLLGALALLADWLVRSEPVVPQAANAQAAPSALVTLRADERLFAVMAALNATGYDRENNPEGMHPVRRAVRADLAAKWIPSRDRLRVQLHVAPPSEYIAWVLGRGDPPAFAREIEGWSLGAPPLLFAGLDGALREFYAQAGIPALWAQHRPAYEAEAARYAAAAEPAVQAALDYLRMRALPTEELVILPNLLDAYGQGYGPRVGATSYVIVGPAIEPNLSEIQHEAMHPIINPLVAAYIGEITPANADRLYAAIKPRAASNYNSWTLVLQESLIRAVELRLAAPEDRARGLDREEQDGFLLVRPLADRLAEYEESGLTFAEYMPRLLRSLNSIDVK